MSQCVGSRGTYDYITSYDSYGYNGYASIDTYVIHWWDDPAKGPTFEGTCNSLCNNPNGSANYVVEAGRVACLIAPGLRAWHVRNNDYQVIMPGIYDINSHSVGIECNPRCSDGDIETLCQLLADLWIDYGVKPIYGHCDFMPTQCPGTYYGYMGYIRSRTEAIYNGIINGTDEEQEDELMSVFTGDEIAYLKQLYADSIKTKPSTWAEADLKKAQEAGITTAERPCDVCSREEAAIMIARATGKLG